MEGKNFGIAYVNNVSCLHYFQRIDNKYSRTCLIASFKLDLLEVAFADCKVFIDFYYFSTYVEIPSKIFNFVNFDSL